MNDPVDSMRWSRAAVCKTRQLLAVVLLGTTAACMRVSPLQGTPTVAKLPPVQLPARPMQLLFTWVYGDDAFSANGDGVVRVLPPDRARLDFFLKNGTAGGFAVLDGDSVFVPGADMTRRLLPPAPMLWAALHRLDLPAAPDTVARQDGDTLRVDIGSFRNGDATSAVGGAWRLAFADNRLVRLERIDKGRVIEAMSRQPGPDGETIRYYHEAAHRRLTIVLADTVWVEGFDDTIWHRR